MSDGLRVGLVVSGDLDDRTGSSVYDRKLATYLDAAGDEVVVVSLPEREYVPAFGANLDPRLIRRLRGCDVVVQDAYCHPSLLGINRLLRSTSVVTVVHYLRWKEERPPWQTRLLRGVECAYFDTVDGFVFNSTATEETVRAAVGGEGAVGGEAAVGSEAAVGNEPPSVVAPPGGDRLGATDTPVPDHLREDPLRVVAVGQVTPRKGTTTLVEGLSRVTGPWELTVVGDDEADPEYARRVRELAARREVADRVTVRGRVSDDRLTAALERSHLLAVPSRYEPFGIVYLEGMAYGLPAVASAHGGADDVVEHGENGFLVEPDDAGAVTDAVAPLVRDRDRLGRLARAAHETYRAHPTWADTCGTVRRFLHRVA